MSQKIQSCQLKLDNKEVIGVILQKIDPRLNIYNILFNDINTLYDHINKITPFTYQQNFYNKIERKSDEGDIKYYTYLLPIIVVIEILFFKTSMNNLKYIIEIYIDISENPAEINKYITVYFKNFKFYELIFKIFFEHKNKNIYDSILYYFNNIFEQINEYLFNENTTIHINDIYIEINKYPPELSEYATYRNILIYSINYFYINNILDMKKIEALNETKDILSTEILEKKENYFKIKDEYLNDKLKGQEIVLDLFKPDMETFIDENGKKITQESILLGEDYNNLIIELFDLYYTL